MYLFKPNFKSKIQKKFKCSVPDPNYFAPPGSGSVINFNGSGKFRKEKSKKHINTIKFSK
jgi:hypothetical protein